MDLRDPLLRLCKERGLSQVELARSLGVSRQAGQVAMGGAAYAPSAIGEAVGGTITFPKESWGTGDAIRSAILSMSPTPPPFW